MGGITTAAAEGRPESKTNAAWRLSLFSDAGNRAGIFSLATYEVAMAALTLAAGRESAIGIAAKVDSQARHTHESMAIAAELQRPGPLSGSPPSPETHVVGTNRNNAEFPTTKGRQRLPASTLDISQPAEYLCLGHGSEVTLKQSYNFSPRWERAATIVAFGDCATENVPFGSTRVCLHVFQYWNSVGQLRGPDNTPAYSTPGRGGIRSRKSTMTAGDKHTYFPLCVPGETRSQTMRLSFLAHANPSFLAGRDLQAKLRL
jgi:hypothetical protein